MNEIWQTSEFFKETENSSVYKLPSFSDGRSFLVWERGSLSIFCYCDIERGELFMPLFLTLLCQGWLHRPLMGAHLRFLLSLCLLKVVAWGLPPYSCLIRCFYVWASGCVGREERWMWQTGFAVDANIALRETCLLCWGGETGRVKFINVHSQCHPQDITNDSEFGYLGIALVSLFPLHKHY